MISGCVLLEKASAPVGTLFYNVGLPGIQQPLPLLTASRFGMEVGWGGGVWGLASGILLLLAQRCFTTLYQLCLTITLSFTLFVFC